MIASDGKTRTIDVANFVMAARRWRQRQQAFPFRMEHVYAQVRKRLVQEYGYANWLLFLDDMGI